MKNVIKAVKKFKFWSRKRKRRRTHEPYYPPPPPTRPPPPPPYHCCCTFSSIQPSAPPLPSWLEAEQSYGTFWEPSDHRMPEKTFPIQTHAPLQQEIVMDTSAACVAPPLGNSSSYQQYMVPEPVYGVPVTQTATRERSSGVFGCAFSFGAHLFRCLFPCFHIREVV
ncbi:hypothetical protein L6164_036129 [Bauhinia variegata]|uniref:Uncharacterized protein n=1 Tax=Bauhinia variegata TaxID=167791 RepID=A0ACB9KG46_BAUVA|nr:hypothetical protein L6164_036129 [Bauhinia variegata]